MKPRSHPLLLSLLPPLLPPVVLLLFPFLFLTGVGALLLECDGAGVLVPSEMGFVQGKLTGSSPNNNKAGKFPCLRVDAAKGR